jgi:hypothetical protein
MNRLAFILVLSSCVLACGAPPVAPAPTSTPGLCDTFETCELSCPEGSAMVRRRELEVVLGVINVDARSVACVKDKVNHGPFVKWHANGTVAMRCQFVDGLKEGLVETWYPSGGRQLKGFKQDGKAHGVWNSWHESGQLHSESLWETNERLSGRCWRRDGTECAAALCLRQQDCH